MQSTHDLFDPFSVDGFAFRNRIAMAAMTRVRMGALGIPAAMNVDYYRQRAAAGLILTEATAVSADGRGGFGTPGLYDAAQGEGWGAVVGAVHAKGARIFAQLWHAGRLSHSSLGPDGRPPVAPTAIRAEGEVHVAGGPVPFELPREITIPEIAGVVADFAAAARRAHAAGFDGIELHAAHGYLIDSFLRDGINRRTDRYGGTIENRARLLFEIVDQVVAIFPPERIAVRLSPNSTYGGLTDRDPAALFGHVVDRLNGQGIGWLDMIEGDNLVTREVPGGVDTDAIMARFAGQTIVGHGYTLAMAEQARRAKRATMIAFGRPFIANPDLVDRLRTGRALAEAPREIWYGSGPEGYTDFAHA